MKKILLLFIPLFLILFCSNSFAEIVVVFNDYDIHEETLPYDVFASEICFNSSHLYFEGCANYWLSAGTQQAYFGGGSVWYYDTDLSTWTNSGNIGAQYVPLWNIDPLVELKNTYMTYDPSLGAPDTQWPTGPPPAPLSTESVTSQFVSEYLDTNYFSDILLNVLAAVLAFALSFFGTRLLYKNVFLKFSK